MTYSFKKAMNKKLLLAFFQTKIDSKKTIDWIFYSNFIFNIL